MRIRLAALGFILAAAPLGAPAAMAADAAPVASAIPCSGVWRLNEQQTHRRRSATGPIFQFLHPWGENGWIRVNTGDAQVYQLPEWHFEQFNGKAYQVFGGDPSLQRVQKFSSQIFIGSRVRNGQDLDPGFFVFSKNCKLLTSYRAEGEDRHAPPGQNVYHNDLRIYERIEPPADAPVAAIATDMFGGWQLNRTASKLTLAPANAETLIVIPWGKSGWVWNQISGGPYQPEELHKGVKRVECGAASGPAAVPCAGTPSHMMLYWATMDSKPYPTYGNRRTTIQVKPVNDRTFEASIAQAQAQGEKATVALSADGRRLTVTTKSGAANGDDVRIYDRIVADNWPTVAQ